MVRAGGPRGGVVSDLNAEHFSEFFAALWRNPPFCWQKELAKRVLDGAGATTADSLIADASSGDETRWHPWPEVIALPTASGKTGCMDVAVFALAAQASRLGSAQPISAPRRVFFVVDRRVIVDEAYERARRLAEKLARARGGILKRVADSLRRIARGAGDKFEDVRPLAVHALRGGMYRSEAWARDPLQPTIVASTVDQIGSRLLFRAYGRGAGTWPIYAGLIANDSLILLDEAHCAKPFLQTLQAVRRYRTWAQVPIGRCFHPVVLSATPPPEMGVVFRDESGEGRDPDHELGRRQLAHKPAALRIVPEARDDKVPADFSKALVQSALDLLCAERRAIVVFVNRVATARESYGLLRDMKGAFDTVLLTGRMRPLDKDGVVARLKSLRLGSSQSALRDLEDPVIVVTTQSLEVGADLDFDGLVTECASLDALRQRFGRLNRMGRAIEARAEILIRANQAKRKRGDSDDPVYGEALSKTWTWLNEQTNENGEVDFGIAHLERLLPKGNALVGLNAPSSDAGVMLPAHIDCWAQTAPVPRPSPDVAPFLHGTREGVPDVQVCWRADIDLTDAEAQGHALESLTLCPPTSSETLPVPIGLFKRWMAGRDSRDDSGDVEGIRAADEQEEDSRLANRRIVRWLGANTNSKDITSNPANIRPGDIVVIPTTHPGPWDQLGDLPSEATGTAAALDVGDAAHRVARAKPILRLHSALVDAWPEFVAAKGAAQHLLKDVAQKNEDDPDEVAGEVRDLLTELSVEGTHLPDHWTWLPRAASELLTDFPTAARLRRECRLVGGHGLVLAGRRRIDELTHEAATFSDEDDAAASGISHPNGRPVPLRTHLPGVEEYARHHVVRCGLPQEMADAIARAGLLHDVGKADPRFQAMLQGGLPWLAGEHLAKSAEMPKTGAAWQRARVASGYPEGGRHELLSVRLAEAAPALLPEDDDLRDLVLHLVASHHGYCRPFAPVVVDHGAPTVTFEGCGHQMQWSGPTELERLDSGVADRYWRLTRRYGWWGLAWLEALLRLADWRRSEWEETHDAGE